jgi:flagellar L-ring protein FlgH
MNCAPAPVSSLRETRRLLQPFGLSAAARLPDARARRSEKPTLWQRGAAIVLGSLQLIGAGLLLAGCSATMPVRESAPLAAARAPVAPPTAGAIYSAGSGFALFEDTKARVVGDLLTVLLIEKTQASKNAETSTSKESSVDIANPTLLGRALSRNGVPIGDFALEGSRSFGGKGDSSQSNQLNGSVTVMVVERLPNGNLIVQGEKNLELNQGSERVRLSGIVRAVDIKPDNTITSDRVADARIEYVGRGALADANSQGWLSRFFNSPWFPF